MSAKNVFSIDAFKTEDNKIILTVRLHQAIVPNMDSNDTCS